MNFRSWNAQIFNPLIYFLLYNSLESNHHPSNQTPRILYNPVPFRPMMVLPLEDWSSALAVLGDAISVMVYLAPIPTFRRIYRRKSTEGFQSVPYIVALFSALLWVYYACLNPNMSILAINIIGCFIETVYVGFYLFYAPRCSKVRTLKLILLVVFMLGAIVPPTYFLVKHKRKKAEIVGRICLAVSVFVFITPSLVVRNVIRSKSVQYMPFPLSLFLTLNAVIWFFYGLTIKDLNVTISNVVGFIFGVVQMGVYLIYKNGDRSSVNVDLPENEMAVGDTDLV